MGLYHQTISVFRPRPQAIWRLSGDVFVDEIFIYLDTEDIVVLRRVCKYFYQLTEHPSIWKRLLDSIDFRLPPLPPTAHYQKVNLSPLEAERLLVRAISWDKSWRTRCPEVFDDWNIDFQYQMNSVVLIPGGRYLIASASDTARHAHHIIVFALDYRHNAVPIAALPVPYKPYNVHAKYMYVKEAPPGDTLLTEELANALPKVPGIVISYVYGKPKSREDRRRDPSGYDDEFGKDPPVPFVRECRCVHIPLNELEFLGSDKMHPASPTYLAAAKRQRTPFRELLRLRSSSRFGPTNFCQIDDSEYFVVVKLPNTIVFQELVPSKGKIEMECASIEPGWAHSILAIRVLPDQRQILVVRRLEPPRGSPPDLESKTSFEAHDIPYQPLQGENPESQPRQILVHYEDDIREVMLPEHDTPLREDRSLRSESNPDLYSGRPLTVYAITADPHGLIMCSFTPKLFPRPPDQLAVKQPSFYTYYDISQESSSSIFESIAAYGTRFRILAGSTRSIVFTIPTSDLTEAPRITTLHRLADDAGCPPPEQMRHSNKTYEKLPKLREIDNGLNFPLLAAAWDETIGRLCLVGKNSTTLWFREFSSCPRTDSRGRRFPLGITVDEGNEGVFDPQPMEVDILSSSEAVEGVGEVIVKEEDTDIDLNCTHIFNAIRN